MIRGVVHGERFVHGDTADGWAYDGERDGGWLLRVRLGDEVRLHAEAGGWVLRGGTAGPTVLWRRGDDEHEAVADGFAGSSPAYDLVLLRRLHLAAGEVRRLRLVAVTEPVLATRLVEQAWTGTAFGAVVEDLATGERRTLTRP